MSAFLVFLANSVLYIGQYIYLAFAKYCFSF